MTLSVQRAAQNNLYVGGVKGGGRKGSDILGQVEQGLLHERERQLCQGYRPGLYLVASSHAGIERRDNGCKYNATNWSRMSVSKKTKNVCFLFFLVFRLVEEIITGVSYCLAVSLTG